MATDLFWLEMRLSLAHRILGWAGALLSGISVVEVSGCGMQPACAYLTKERILVVDEQGCSSLAGIRRQSTGGEEDPTGLCCSMSNPKRGACCMLPYLTETVCISNHIQIMLDRNYASVLSCAMCIADKSSVTTGNKQNGVDKHHK